MHIKKITSTVISVIIALSISVTSIFADSTATVNSSILNVRTGPGITYTKITTIDQNDTVTILEGSKGWYKVRLSNGQEGWVSSEYLTVQGINDTVGYSQVSMTLDEYIDSQVEKTNKSVEALKPYIDPNNFTIENKQTFMQFLKIDKFREIDVQGLNTYLNNITVTSGKSNIFYNKGQVFVDVARKYNIDPIYLVAHTLHETGFGMSSLAQGYYVVLGPDGKAIRDIVEIKDSEGNVTKTVSYVRLKDTNTPTGTPTVKVHNLFGIGAVDAAVIPGGTTTAYDNNWDSIENAIDGSAKWISDGYIYRSPNNQNTVYKMRFDYVGTWHQYATDTGWADKISRYMNELSYLYTTTSLEFEVPKYSTPSYTVPVIGDNSIETKYVFNTDSVNVRTGPTTKFRDVGDLLKNTEVEVYGYTSNGWAITKINGEVRYIDGNYLTSTKPAVVIINFEDIQSHWAKASIEQFVSKGYINGYDDKTFRPNNSITRAEFVKILNKSFGLTTKSGKVFNDTSSHWAKDEIDIAVTNGVCSGKSATEFKPNDPITREEAAAMIANYKNLSDTNYDKLNKYRDRSQVSSWAKASVESIIEKGYMGGYEDGTFRPKGKITRAEAVVTLSRVE